MSIQLWIDYFIYEYIPSAIYSCYSGGFISMTYFTLFFNRILLCRFYWQIMYWSQNFKKVTLKKLHHSMIFAPGLMETITIKRRWSAEQRQYCRVENCGRLLLIYTHVIILFRPFILKYVPRFIIIHYRGE